MLSLKKFLWILTSKPNSFGEFNLKDEGKVCGQDFRNILKEQLKTIIYSTKTLIISTNLWRETLVRREGETEYDS